ncbi:unnamed protein product [Moneuplotes crassus]|uniref:PPM-type phosphatase domain-containing protein n=1 Tax=Euplotes crassus TaxID=5936 RepID=A0AAD1YAW0_EUPCR|nr:unnamed protein product [Moneuplotes crassus]
MLCNSLKGKKTKRIIFSNHNNEEIQINQSPTCPLATSTPLFSPTTELRTGDPSKETPISPNTLLVMLTQNQSTPVSTKKNTSILPLLKLIPKIRTRHATSLINPLNKTEADLQGSFLNKIKKQEYDKNLQKQPRRYIKNDFLKNNLGQTFKIKPTNNISRFIERLNKRKNDRSLRHQTSTASLEHNSCSMPTETNDEVLFNLRSVQQPYIKEDPQSKTDVRGRIRNLPIRGITKSKKHNLSNDYSHSKERPQMHMKFYLNNFSKVNKKKSLLVPLHDTTSKVKAEDIFRRTNPNFKMSSVFNAKKIICDTTITDYGYSSKCGYQPDNPSKENQDSPIILPNFCKIEKGYLQGNIHLFGICDGHGKDGLKISSFIAKEVPEKLKDILSSGKDLYQSITLAVNQVEKELFESRKVDYTLSGTTCCLAIIKESMLYFVNIGDSRAIFFPNSMKSFTSKKQEIFSTTDHNCNIDKEYKRILKSNGRVERINGIGPLRVWLKDENRPGLAMTRSIGDETAKKIGVISTPEITIHPFDTKESTLIIGSDGLFEFVNNQELIEKYNDLYSTHGKSSAQEISEELVATCSKTWQKKEEYIDDISCIVVNFSSIL